MDTILVAATDSQPFSTPLHFFPFVWQLGHSNMAAEPLDLDGRINQTICTITGAFCNKKSQRSSQQGEAITTIPEFLLLLQYWWG
jgi:hypothetical protein